MKEVFLYDVQLGYVYRCLFAGLDSQGHAQWVNITTDDWPETIQDAFGKDKLKRYRVLSGADSPASSLMVSKILLNELHNSVEDMQIGLGSSIYSMEKIGVYWNFNSLDMCVQIDKYDNGEYAFSIDLSDLSDTTYAYLDGFQSIKDLSNCVETFVGILKKSAHISIKNTVLRYNKELKREIEKSYQGNNEYTHELLK